MKTNKIYFKYITGIFLGVMVAGMLAACQDQLLNKSPRGKRTQVNFFESQSDAVQATNATYEQLVNFNRNDDFDSSVHYIWWLGMTDIASDDANKGTEPTDGTDVGRVDNVNYRPIEGVFSGTWTWYYRVIARANSAIKNIPSIDMNEELKNRLIGENKFLRAYAYFFLVRQWGGVPLIKKPVELGDFNLPRDSAEDVYGLIEKDLQDAIVDLPVKSNYSPSDIGRATKGAAQGMLAKVYLFEEKYEQAEKMAKNVISSNEYELMPDYGKIFTPQGENSTGSLFEIQAVAESDGSAGTAISNVQGVRGKPNLGWGFNSPERDLLQDYESGDLRMMFTVLFVHEILPRGPEDVVRDNPKMIDERYNQKSFIPTDNPAGNFNGGNNIRRLRYADVLLIAAESAYHNNNIADARRYTNMVRKRARGGREATIGIEPESLAGLVADTVGMPSLYKYPFVRYVNPRGPAEGKGIKAIDWELVNTNTKLEIKNLDVITSVDGVPTATVQEYQNQMKQKSAGQQVEIGIQRLSSGTSEELSFTITTQDLLPDIQSSGDQLLKDIWHERRIELALEQQRMFDIRRQGRAGKLLRAQGKDYVDGKNDLFPIPQAELDVNPNLEQNPGYN